MSQPEKLTIDIVSDVVCPWCVVGYKNLESALSVLNSEVNAQLKWHPFELNPYMGEPGQELREHLAEKYGSSIEDSEEIRKRITDSGKTNGFDFNWSNGMRIYNTFNCHRLLHWANLNNKQHALQMALFELYFSENNPLNDEETIISAVESVGLDPHEAKDILNSDQFKDEVRSELDKYKSMGINSVPTFIINNKYAISGGQPADVFVQSLRQILQQENSSNL